MTFVLRRLAVAVPVLFGVTVLAFLLVHLTPGDPAKVILFGANAGPAQIARLRTSLGLDEPWWQQYLLFLGNLLHGDLGTSYLTQTPVAQELLSRAPSTIELTVAALVVSVGVGVPLGLVGGVRPGSALDRIASLVSFVGVGVPYFFLALVLVLVFSVNLGLLPAIDDGTPAGLLLPAFSLGWGYAAILTRLVRGRVIEEMRSEYVRSARARGCSEPRVLFAHVLRNAATPAITTLGLQFGNILTGAAVTEVIFGRAGIGSFLATAIANKNIPVVQGAIVIIGAAYVLINLTVDLTIGVVDPRNRFATA